MNDFFFGGRWVVMNFKLIEREKERKEKNKTNVTFFLNLIKERIITNFAKVKNVA